MGFFDDFVEKAKLYFSNKKVEVVHEVENLDSFSPDKQEAVNRLREDLGIKLLPNDREFLQTVISEDIIKDVENGIDREYWSCSHHDIGTESEVIGPSAMEGFKPIVPELKEIVNSYGCGDEKYSVLVDDMDELFNCTSGNEKAYNMIRFCMENFSHSVWHHKGSMAFRPHDVECFTAENMTEKAVNKVMNRELNAFLDSLENSNEPEAKKHLCNARAVLVVNNDAQHKWQSIAKNSLTKVIESNFEKKLEKENSVTYVFRNEALKSEMYDKVIDIDKKIKDIKSKFLHGEQEMMWKAYRERNADELKKIVSFSLPAQKLEIERINSLTRSINLIKEEYVNKDKGYVNEKTVKIAKKYRQSVEKTNSGVAEGR